MIACCVDFRYCWICHGMARLGMASWGLARRGMQQRSAGNRGPFYWVNMGIDWTGMTVACLASGPSLDIMDVERVRRWRLAGDDRRVIVTNTTFRLALWADTLFAMDSAWWRHHGTEAQEQFRGERLTKAPGLAPGATRIQCHPSGNSGAGAITLALRRAAARVILLGYDCQYAPNGQRHWYGNHPKGLSNCVSIAKFPRQFQEVKQHFREADVINASRVTALDVWPRMSLEEALQ